MRQSQATLRQQEGHPLALHRAEGGEIPGHELRGGELRILLQQRGLLGGVEPTVDVGRIGLRLGLGEAGVVELRELSHPGEIVVARAEDDLVLGMEREPRQDRQRRRPPPRPAASAFPSRSDHPR